MVNFVAPQQRQAAYTSGSRASSSSRALADDQDVMMDDAELEDMSAQDRRIVGPGEAIADSNRWMRGHGTYTQDDKVYASVAGTLERVNKLISVRPLRTRYRPEVGDLVVGRIVEVAAKRWKVDAFASQNAVLMLSSINLPGGVQRRKLESDELQMRNFFTEGDLLVAEVQAFFADGAISLHTRSLKYGKLRNGVLVTVPPTLVVRLKSHFHTLPCGVELIVGLNGYIWVAMASEREVKEDDEVGFQEESGEGVYSSVNDEIPDSTRLNITRVAMLIALLARHHLPISVDVVAEAYSVSYKLADDDNVTMIARPEVGEEILRSLTAQQQKS